MAEGKGGGLGDVYTFPSTMAQNFWIAIFAFGTCVLVTTAVSLVTTPHPDRKWKGWYTVSPGSGTTRAHGGTSAPGRWQSW